MPHQTKIEEMLLIFLLVPCIAWNQTANYSLNKVHSHNDYWQKRPFHLAYRYGLGSVEADTYLWQGKLLVAHDTAAIRNDKSLQSLYLEPLKKVVESHHGFPFADTSLTFQLLIELKSDADTEIKVVGSVLKSYPAIITNAKINIVFTGNTPSEKAMADCPDYMKFDGQLSHDFTPSVLKHIAMLSDNLQDFITWDGKKNLSRSQRAILAKWVRKGHRLRKKVRFWNAPDNPLAWKELMNLGVDYINTDHIEAIASFFNQ